MMDFGRRAFQFYVSQGYQPHQAAALAGNAIAESRGSTSILGDRGKALGIFQWHPDRQANLMRYAQQNNLDPRAENTQLGFKHWELNNTENRAGDLLRASTDVTSANNAVLNSLRPQGFTRADPTQSHNYQGRLNLANQLIGSDLASTVGSPAADGVDVAPLAMTPTPGAPQASTAGLIGNGFNMASAGMNLANMGQQQNSQAQAQEIQQLWKMAMASPARAHRPGLLG